ncbi:hypothetical protein QL285_088664 [Trifolium repens]|nr:hypothetical protein QL285_088664 [Trifolium repens]
MKVVVLVLSFPTHVHPSYLDQRSPSYGRFGKSDLSSSPRRVGGECRASSPALTRPELALSSPGEFSNPETYLFLKNMMFRLIL